MNEPETLVSVDPEKFATIWKVFTELGVAERHFNDLQTRYRALASTWLLASFTAAGFILSQSSLDIPIDRLIMIAGIGIAASIGILLLWNLDLKVYHQLLSAGFAEGCRLEQTYPWLPQVRTGMRKRVGERGVLPRVIWFYICGNSIVLTMSGIALGFWAYRFGVPALILTVVVTIAVIALLGTYLLVSTQNEEMSTDRSSDRSAKNPEKG